MSNFCIELLDETGSRVIVPLWKLPQMCQDDVDAKRVFIAAEKAAKDAREMAEKMAEQARAQAIIDELAAVDNPATLATITPIDVSAKSAPRNIPGVK